MTCKNLKKKKKWNPKYAQKNFSFTNQKKRERRGNLSFTQWKLG